MGFTKQHSEHCGAAASPKRQSPDVPTASRHHSVAYWSLDRGLIATNALMIHISSLQDIDRVLQERIRFDVEELWALALNNHLELIEAEMIFRGHVTATVFHPREILRFAIRHSAVSLVIAHSHPSGHNEPSPQDLILTEGLFHICRLIEIPLIDHVIMAKTGSHSLAADGWLSKWSARRPFRQFGR